MTLKAHQVNEKEKGEEEDDVVPESPLLPLYTQHDETSSSGEAPKTAMQQFQSLLVEIVLTLLVALSLANLIVGYLREHGVVFSVSWHDNIICGPAAAIFQGWPFDDGFAQAAVEHVSEMTGMPVTVADEACRTVHKVFGVRAR